MLCNQVLDFFWPIQFIFTDSKQKRPFSEPTHPVTSVYIIYEWSLIELRDFFSKANLFLWHVQCTYVTLVHPFLLSSKDSSLLILLAKHSEFSRVIVQGVVLLVGQYAPIWFLWNRKNIHIIAIFQKENGNNFTLLINLIVKSLQNSN